MSSLSVRAATITDAAAINRIYNHYVGNTSITFDLEPWSTRHRETWLAEFAGQHAHHIVVTEQHGIITGFAYNSSFRQRAAYRRSTETTIYTAPNNQTRGTGTALYEALFQRIAQTDLHRAYAVIALPNPGSITFHQRFGFAAIGTLHQVGHKFGGFVDVAWYEKKLR